MYIGTNTGMQVNTHQRSDKGDLQTVCFDFVFWFRLRKSFFFRGGGILASHLNKHLTYLEEVHRFRLVCISQREGESQFRLTRGQDKRRVTAGLVTNMSSII